MIKYLGCDTVSDDLIYEAFGAGFSDYIVEFDMKKDMFISRFFGPEGNSRELSYVALEDKKPLGIVLGGIKDLDGVRTMRCGALCVIPELRGKGVAQKLMKLHEEKAYDEACKQLFLEVIAGNLRGVSFYRKLGYEKIYDITFYSIERKLLEEAVSKKLQNKIDIKKVDFQTVRDLRYSLEGLHMNWQSDVEYFKDLDCTHLGAYIDNRLIGCLSYHERKVLFLWIAPQYRFQGVSKNLLSELLDKVKFEKLNFTMSNNANMQNYCKHLGMIENELHEYEMYKWIG